MCSNGIEGVAACALDGQSFGACQCPTSVAAGGQLNAAGGSSSAGGGSAGTWGSAGSPGQVTASGGSGSIVTGLPCDVKAIVERQCGSCHGSTTKFGAPMTLVTAADFHVPALDNTQSMAERVLARIQDDTRPMPPPPNARLSDADRAVIERWIQSGAPAAACQLSNTSGGAGGAVGVGGAGGSPAMDGTGGIGGTTSSPNSSVTCYNLTARASAAGDKYKVPKTPDLYRCFNYAPPWGNKKVQVVSARPIIDNDRVIHHWILYNTSGSVSDGTNGSCAHPNAAFIVGWAPGGNAMELPPDVGLRIDGAGFTLENHYNNTVGEGELDASGTEICVTEDLRPKEAAVHWLGTTSLNKINASGTCTPANQVPVNIISSSPHMHLQGRHMKTVINRKGGGADILIDTPFDFNTQISYPTPAVIQPGDTLTTTCTYATPTPFGPGTNDEMCFNFVMAYPAGQLARNQALRKNDCTGR